MALCPSSSKRYQAPQKRKRVVPFRLPTIKRTLPTSVILHTDVSQNKLAVAAMAAVGPVPAPLAPESQAAPVGAPAAPPLTNSSLYVGGLDPEIMETQLFEVFSQVRAAEGAGGVGGEECWWEGWRGEGGLPGVLACMGCGGTSGGGRAVRGRWSCGGHASGTGGAGVMEG